MNKIQTIGNGHSKCQLVWAAALATLTMLLPLSVPNISFAAPTDIARSPLASGASGQVKPNIMLLLDTSISMSWTHIPDDVEGTAAGTGVKTIGYKSYQCNALYFNPNTPYTLPKDASGNPLATPSFTAAPYSGYDASLGSTNLSSSFQAFYGVRSAVAPFARDPKSTLANLTTNTSDPNYVDTPQLAYYYIFTPASGVAPSALSPTGARCRDTDTLTGNLTTKPAAISGTWTRYTVSAAQQANFAIWYTYYRTRILLAKSSVSLAFSPLTDNYRVGFITVLPNDPLTAGSGVLSSKYLPIADFGAAQRTAWFNKLFSQQPGFSSPTREGLARVGRHYAGKQDGINVGMTGDPIQYSCQPNFTIMTTDGYWNSPNESSPGGPVQLDGVTLVGQQDGGSPTGTLLDFPLPSPFPVLDPTTILPPGYKDTYRLSSTPIFDGSASNTLTTTFKTNNYSLSPCPSSAFFWSVRQQQQATNQDRVGTSQTNQTQTQMSKSTNQNRESTSFVTASTTQVTQATLQRYSTTTQIQATQRQTTRTTSTQQQTTYNLQISTIQNRATTQQNLANTSQQFAVITQNLETKIQKQEVKTQTTADTIQYKQSVTQTMLQTLQYSKNQTQTTKTTTQNQQISNVISQSTSTFVYKDLFTESTLQGNACPGGARYQCTGTGFGVVNTGPTPTTSCTAVGGSGANNFVTTTCSNSNPALTPTNIGPACVAQSASSSNGYTTITCPAAIVTNIYVMTPGSCVAAPAGNPIVACNTATLTNLPVDIATCTAGTSAATAYPGTGYTVTTCPQTINTTAAIAATTCTGQTQTATSPSWTSKTCAISMPVVSNTPVACVAGTGVGPTYYQTTCPAPVVATSTAVPAGCSVGNVTPFPNYVKTTACYNPILSTIFNPTCTNVGPTFGNSYTTTTCTSTINQVNLPIAGTCVTQAPAAINNQTTTSCNNGAAVSNNPVASCSAGVGGGPTYYRTACPPPTTTANTGVQNACVIGTNLGSFQIITSCPPAINSTAPQAGACIFQAATAFNGWQTISCPLPNPVTTGPTFVATCTAIAPTFPSYVQTICTQVNTTTTTVGTCTPGTSGSPPLITTCGSATTGSTFVANPASCTPAPAPANPVVTCSTTAPTNNYIQGPCAIGDGTALNNWYETTACPAVVPVEAFANPCTPQAANLGNSWKTITCTTGANTSAFVPAASCVPQTPTALTTPKWTRITCTPSNLTLQAVQEPCVVGTDLGNSKIVTACNAPTVTTTVPVASCTPQTASAGNGWFTRTCPAAMTSGPTFVDPATCAASGPTSFNSYTSTVCTPSTFSAATPVNPLTCTTPSSLGTGPNYVTTTCTTTTTGPTDVARGTCTPLAPVSPGWTTTNCTTNNTATAYVPPGTCTASTGSTSPFVETICTDLGAGLGTNGVNPSATCPASPSPFQAGTVGNNYKEITCTTAPGLIQNFTTDTSTQFTKFSGGTKIYDSGVSAPVTSASAPVDGVCYAIGALSPLPVLTAYTSGVPGTGGRPLNPVPPAGCTTPGVWPCIVDVGVSGGSINSLADVAQYYYVTDLRDAALGNDIGALGTDVSLNNVPINGNGKEDDRAPWQHMTTFAIGLGVSGVLNYTSTYKTDTSGDYYDIKNILNNKSWPVPPITGDAPETIDDFWHAAVNGRGQFFNANNAQDVVSGVQNVLASINAVTGSGAAAASSTQQPVSGNNFAYLAQYTSSIWTGDIQARQIDLATGNVQSTNIWPGTASSLIEQQRGNACDNRTIYLMRAGTANLVNFTWNTKACDASLLPTGLSSTALNTTEKAYFGSTAVTNFSQYLSMTDGTGSPATIDQRTAAAGPNLVNFIRGQKGREGFQTNDPRLYRTRAAALGAIINAQPVFVKALAAQYAENNYAAFNATTQTRTPMVYVAANDGMLHAFYAGNSLTDPLGGSEAWAVIPGTVLPNLYKLADRAFDNNFQYSVDGTPTVGDAFDPSANAGSGAWKTILVGGLNAGGQGYYALDVTDPLNPIGQWEFKWSDTCYAGTAATDQADCHLGYTFGNPTISKLANGTWVVMVTSGYNNVNAPAKIGDGVGYLYVLNAFTGRIISKIATGAGDATTPSGLSKIANYVDNSAVNNTTRQVYGGDLLGNIWRFDVNDNIPPAGINAVRIGTALDSSGVAQPITTKPELAALNGKPMVFIATGRLLGASDLTNTQVQSTYGIVDTLPATGADPLYSNLRSILAPLAITQTSGTAPTRTTACTGTPAQCASTAGWVVDLLDSGERVNIDPKLQLGTLVFASNVPQGTACNIGGYSYLNYVSYSSGLAVGGSGGSGGSGARSTGQKIVMSGSAPGIPPAGSPPTTSLAVGFNFYQLPGGTVGGFVTGSDGTPIAVRPPIGIDGPKGHRISWREIVQ